LQEHDVFVLFICFCYIYNTNHPTVKKKETMFRLWYGPPTKATSNGNNGKDNSILNVTNDQIEKVTKMKERFYRIIEDEAVRIDEIEKELKNMAEKIQRLPEKNPVRKSLMSSARILLNRLQNANKILETTQKNIIYIENVETVQRMAKDARDVASVFKTMAGGVNDSDFDKIQQMSDNVEELNSRVAELQTQLSYSSLSEDATIGDDVLLDALSAYMKPAPEAPSNKEDESTKKPVPVVSNKPSRYDRRGGESALKKDLDSIPKVKKDLIE
jgi:outer membrane murein-binding lipoprotein Lpp